MKVFKLNKLLRKVYLLFFLLLYVSFLNAQTPSGFNQVVYEGFDYIDYGIHDEYSNKTKRLAQSIYDLKDDLKLIKNDDPYFEAYRSISRVYIPAALSLAKIVSKQGTLDILKEDKEMLDSLSDKFETLRSDIKKVKKNEDKIKYDEWTSFL